MAQLFRPEANAAFRFGILAAGLGLLIVLAGGFLYVRSDWFWRVGESADQPIPFRHDLHVSGVGIACLFCHSTAEQVAPAGMPTAQTCLTCHSQILQGASVLEPLRTSAALGQPILWASVHRLPSFVYFHHGIHVANGITCQTCHGQVEQMRQTHKVHSLSMGWCLDCHRNTAPQRNLAGGGARKSMDAASAVQSREKHPLDVSKVFATPLTNCSVCHR